MPPDGPLLETEEGPAEPREGLKLLVRTALGLLALLAVVALLGRYFREPLASVGLGFVRRFGLLGMFVGTFLADAFTFPVPPQFYLWTAVAGGGSQAAAVGAICAASLLAGSTGYHLAQRLGSTPLFQRLLAPSRKRLDPLFARYGAWAIAIGSVTPVPYSVLCYLCGLYRVNFRLFSLLILLRIPRILFFYVAIRAGWVGWG